MKKLFALLNSKNNCTPLIFHGDVCHVCSIYLSTILNGMATLKNTPILQFFPVIAYYLKKFLGDFKPVATL